MHLHPIRTPPGVQQGTLVREAIYRVPCPLCGVKGETCVDMAGYAGVACPAHGIILIPRRPPTVLEQEGKEPSATGIHYKVRKRKAKRILEALADIQQEEDDDSDEQ